MVAVPGLEGDGLAATSAFHLPAKTLEFAVSRLIGSLHLWCERRACKEERQADHEITGTVCALEDNVRARADVRCQLTPLHDLSTPRSIAGHSQLIQHLGASVMLGITSNH